MFDRQGQVMTTMSEQSQTSSVWWSVLSGSSCFSTWWQSRFRRGCHRYRWQVLPAFGRWLGKDQASLLAEQKLFVLFFVVVGRNFSSGGFAFAKRIQGKFKGKHCNTHQEEKCLYILATYQQSEAEQMTASKGLRGSGL